MAFTITPLKLFRYTCELEKMHHLIVTNCGCMNKVVVGGGVNLVQILEHKIQMFVGNRLAPLPHCHR